MESEIEDVLNQLPDEIVADDIKNYLNKTTDSHLFSNIYEGKTIISPFTMIKHFKNQETIILYHGGFGLGKYVEIAYSKKQNKYIYYTLCNEENKNYKEHFKCENWVEFCTYVRQHLLDTYF